MDILLTAVEKSFYDLLVWLQCATFPDLQCEKKVALAVVNKMASLGEELGMYVEHPVEFLSESLCDDKELMMEFVMVSGDSLKHCSQRLQEDVDIVKAAVKMRPSVVTFSTGEIREELVSDCEFLLSAIKDGAGKLLVHAPPAMQQDKSVVLEAVANGFEYHSIPTCFQTDSDIALTALETYSVELTDWHESLQSSKKFALSAVKVYYNLDEQLPGDLQEDKEVALQRLISAGDVFYSSPEALIRLVLEKVPSLLDSKEAMMNVFNTTAGSRIHPYLILDVLESRPFLDEEGVCFENL